MSSSDLSFHGFLKAVREISQTTEDQHSVPLAHLRSIDQIFVDWVSGAGKVSPLTASILILNSHASFRASMVLALSGQLMPVFMTLRGSLESALYANAITTKPHLEDVWMQRDRDEASRDLCKRQFTISKMFAYLEEAQNETFAEVVREAYSLMIDFGAHPNRRSIIGSTEIVAQTNGDHLLDFTYLHGPRSGELRRCLVACADVGYLSLVTSLIASRGHPNKNELADKAETVRDELSNFIAALSLEDPHQ